MDKSKQHKLLLNLLKALVLLPPVALVSEKEK